METMEDKVINLVSLVFNMALHWRSLVVAGIIGAVLATGYSSICYAAVITQSAEEKVGTVVDDEDVVGIYANSVKNYNDMQESLSKSVFMSLDGKNVAKTGVTLVVKGKRIECIKNIADTYRNIIVSRGAVRYICENEGIQDTGITELIITSTNTNKNNETNVKADVATYEVSDAEVDFSESIYFEVLGKDVESSERIANLIIDYLKQTHGDVSTNLGEHSLMVMSKDTTIGVDVDIINRQGVYARTLSDLYDIVDRQQKNLTEEQLALYNALEGGALNENSISNASDANDQIIETVTGNANDASRPHVDIKYSLLGMMGGVFCMACIWAALYVFSNRLKPEDPYEKLFGIGVMGMIPSENGKKRILGFIDRLIIEIRDHNKRRFSVDEALSLIVSRVKVQSAKDKISKLALIGCDMEKNVPMIPSTMAKKLEEDDVYTVVLDNVLYNPENTEKLGDIEGVVIVEKAGKTLYSELAGEIELLKRQQIKLLGLVIVE